MVRRDKRMIGREVEIISGGSWTGQRGIVKGFRGNDTPGVPHVNVWLFKQGSIFPIKGTNLRLVKA